MSYFFKNPSGPKNKNEKNKVSQKPPYLIYYKRYFHHIFRIEVANDVDFKNDKKSRPTKFFLMGEIIFFYIGIYLARLNFFNDNFCNPYNFLPIS